MLERPFYQTTIAFLSVLALVGGAVFLAVGNKQPGIKIVPAPTPTAAIAGESAAATRIPGLVNINTATAEEMASGLPGIGPVLSERIVAYREEHGAFVRSDQLMDVTGIGQTTFERLRDLVTVAD